MATFATIEDGEDFLDELIRKRTLRNANFPPLVEAASARRALLRALAEARAESGLTQTQAAALMGTSQSQVARLESGGADTKPGSTVLRDREALVRVVRTRGEGVMKAGSLHHSFPARSAPSG